MRGGAGTRRRGDAGSELDAIPSVYNSPFGPVAYCRSRLECRWLAWLDAMAIPWIYEPIAFTVAGRGFIPDVHLPRETLWLEVKPEGHEPDHGRYQAFADGERYRLAIVCGLPRIGGYRVTLYRPDIAREEGMVFACGRRDHAELWLCSIESGVAVCLSERSARLNWPVHSCHALGEASRVAMSHRFAEGR